MQTADLLPSRFSTLKRFATEQNWNRPSETRLRAQRYREAESRAVNAVRKLCWNNASGLIADTPAQKHFSQHANILGVWLDVIPREQQKDVLNKILSVSDPGFTSTGPVPEMTKATYYFRFYLARALEHAGMGDQYLNLLKPWRDMTALGSYDLG